MNSPTYSKSFLRIVNFIIDEIERGRSNRASDRGGDTNYGISDMRDGKRDGLIDVDNDGTGDIAPGDLSRDQAIAIYWRDYWCAARCDQLPERMAAFVFDGAIQHRRLPNGGFVGASFLQGALGVLADGVLGPQSLGRAWSYKNNAEVLAIAFSLRTIFYRDIALADSTQNENIKGWFKRLYLLQQFICSIVPDPNEARP